MQIKAKSNLTVWDKNKSCILCKFDSKGILNTEDQYIITELTKLGYIQKKKRGVGNESK